MPGTRSASSVPERAPRFEARVPQLGDLELVPRDLAQIIGGRQVRGRRKIGERQLVAGEPAALMRQMAHVAHMVAQVCLDGAQDVGRGRWIGAGHEAGVNLLVQQLVGDLAVELAVEPVDEPAHLGAGLARAGEKLERRLLVLLVLARPGALRRGTRRWRRRPRAWARLRAAAREARPRGSAPGTRGATPTGAPPTSSASSPSSASASRTARENGQSLKCVSLCMALDLGFGGAIRQGLRLPEGRKSVRSCGADVAPRGGEFC